MKLKDNVNLVEFLRNVKKCKSDVFLKTENEDMLNLKSILSQYVLVVLAEKKELLENARVICKGDEDYQVLMEYLAV